MTHDEVLALARSQVPWWVAWWPLLMIAAAALVGRFLAWIGSAVAIARIRRVPPAAHWTERARDAAGARAICQWAMVGAGIVGGTLAICGPLAPLRPVASVALASMAAMLGSLGAFGAVQDALGVPPLARQAKPVRTYLFASAPVAPFTIVVASALAHVDDHAAAAMLWALGGLLLAAWMRGGWAPIARAVGAIEDAPPTLAQTVARAAEKVGGPIPVTFVTPSRLANAFAHVFSGHLVLTAGAVASLDGSALEAIALHELGHLREPPRALALRALKLGAFYALAALPILWAIDVAWAFVSIAAYLVSMIAMRAVGVRLEREADAVAHEHAVEGAYAHALERLAEVNVSPVVARAERTHPHLYDRMVAAGVTPSYPRPAPPEPAGVRAAAVLLASLALAFGIRVALDRYATGDLAIAATGDARSHAARLRAIDPARARLFSLLAEDDAPPPSSRPHAQGGASGPVSPTTLLS